MAFNNTVIARAAAGIFGLQLGNGTTTSVLAQANSGTSLNSIINDAFNDSYGNISTPVVAAAVVNNLGLTGQAATDGQDYINNALAGVPNDQRGAAIADIVNLFSTLGTDPVYGSFANDFNARVAASVNYAATNGTGDQAIGPIASGVSFFLGTGQDNITGTSANDTFNAYIFDNQNTLQSGDFVNGGAGVDTLYADMGSSQNFAVTPRTINVENIVIRGQSRANDTGDNNVAGATNDVFGRVDIDAERIVGATRFESNNSRADVIVEDVRILPSQITKDITVAFVDSDPGNVDFGVYFDQLTANRTSSSSLTLQVIDIKGALADPTTPLLNSPYDGISFSLNGQLVLLQDDAINNALTYQQLVDAINTQLRLNPLTNGVVTATIANTGTFSVLDSNGGGTVTGQNVVLSAPSGTFGIGNFIASQGVPALSNLYTNQVIALSNTQDLVTSTVDLDNVGRGSNGGDLVIGALSVGETSNSKGVDRFNITVDRTSRLQNIDSTNNTLKEVTIKNGTTNGDLYVYGNVGANGRSLGPIGESNDQSGALPGAVAQHDSWGFNDVRLIDASSMVGKVTFDAIVTPDAFNKYINLTDTGPTAPGDNVSTPGQTNQVADFIYSGGSNNDTINVQIDGGIAGSNSDVQVGREDFTFRVNGNAGDDNITLRIVDGDEQGGLQIWYGHQHSLKNVTVDGGAGNDTIRTPGAGDVKILGGDGNDTIYTDNTGAQDAGAVRVIGGGTISGPIVNGPGAATPANTGGVDLPASTNLAYTNFNLYNVIVANGQNAMWTFNTSNSGDNGITPDLAREISDLKSDANDGYNLYRATVTVNFKGLTKTLPLPNSTFKPTDLYINQQMKAAINLDPVLSKLLVAVDGPAYSLVVKSLIDGAMATGDLTVTVTTARAADFGVSELAQAAAAYNLPVGSTAADVQAVFDAAIAAFNTASDYGTGAVLNALTGTSTASADFAENNTNLIQGADSTYASDNVVTPGAGNDVIVLGTDGVTAGTVPVNLDASNDTVAYTPVFGNDTIVNFEALGAGIDKLDFTAIGGTSAGSVAGLALSQNDGSIYIVPASAANDTLPEIAAYFPDSGVNTAVQTHVVVVVDATGTAGSVYTVTDGIGGTAGVGNVTAVLAGTIDLADTPWGTLDLANFA